MKHFGKFTTLALVLVVLIFVLVGCGSPEAPTTDKSKPEANTESADKKSDNSQEKALEKAETPEEKAEILLSEYAQLKKPDILNTADEFLTVYEEYADLNIIMYDQLIKHIDSDSDAINDACDIISEHSDDWVTKAETIANRLTSSSSNEFISEFNRITDKILDANNRYIDTLDEKIAQNQASTDELKNQLENSQQ